MTVKEALSYMSPFLGEQGSRPSSKKAMWLMNRARRLVHPMDDWVHTIKYYCLTLDDCCFTLPHDVKAIRAAWDGNSVVKVSNEYFDSIPREIAMDGRGVSTSFFRTGRNIALPARLCGTRKLSFIAEDLTDKGMEVTVMYQNTSGSQLTDHLKLNEDFLPVETTEEVRNVLSISKEPTRGQVQVVDNNKVVYTMLPNFTNGRHEQYKVDGEVRCSRVLVKCKIAERDYTDADLGSEIDMQSIDALEFAAMAITAKGKQELGPYKANLSFARQHLDIDKIDIESSVSGFEPMVKAHDSPVTEYEQY
tara:strand:- start:25297 stop:26214 length:918 start_codon:yes stop_codon:yes gene_type:complete